MIALRNAAVVIEGLLIGVLVLFLAMTVFDLPYAWHAQPCSIERSSGCYPWGAEGPSAGLWTYASKRNYLVWSVFEAVVLCAALVGALLLPQGRRIFVLLVGGVLAYLSRYFLPLIV
jgi:hypothetical protein